MRHSEAGFAGRGYLENDVFLPGFGAEDGRSAGRRAPGSHYSITSSARARMMPDI